MVFRERLTERQFYFMEHLDGFGFLPTTENCVPHMMVKTTSGSLKHNVLIEQGAN